MFKKILMLVSALLLTNALPALSAIVADHTTTNRSAIPDTWINTAKSNLRLSYGHTSHGSQPISGMDVLFQNFGSLYSFNSDGATAPGTLSLHDYTPVGDLGHNGDTTWATATRTYLNAGSGTGPTRNVVIWSWCGGVSDNTPQGIDTYLNTMNQLEQDYPNVTFVYMTGHLDGTGSNGTLNLMNERIRAYCRTNNKILFDFADIESYDPSGYYYLDQNADDNCDYDGGHNWATDWCAGHPGHELCAPVADCAHSQSLNCNLKARAFWWLLARIAGWTGSSDITPPVLSNGAPAGALPAGTQQTTLLVTSNETATCRFSTVAGISYTAMTSTFATTGGLSHQHPLSNLQNSQSYSYFIRCKDAANNSNTSDYPVQFSVAAPSAKSVNVVPANFLLLRP